MKLVIRTEASTTIGLGHFMRCFALAEAACEQGLAVTFVVNADAPVAARARAIGARVVTAPSPGQDFDVLDTEVGPDDWLIVDSYEATEDYLTALSKRSRVAVIDDLNVLDRFDCNVLINPTPSAPKDSYAAKSRARLLLGPDYALVRGEFRHAAAVGDHCVTLTFGGSDPTGLTAIIAQQLHAALPDATIRAIAGPANRHIAELLALSQRLERMQLLIDPPSMAEALSNSGLVVTAAGGSVNEIASMGLPAVALVVYDNQIAWLDACPFPAIDARAGIPVGFAAEVAVLMADPLCRDAIAQAAHKIVDGQGVFRILDVLCAQ